MTGVNHQPLKVGFVGYRFQQLGPDAMVPASGSSGDGCSSSPRSPAASPARGRRAGAQNPEDGVEESKVILSGPAHLALAAGQKGCEDFPDPVGDVVPDDATLMLLLPYVILPLDC